MAKKWTVNGNEMLSADDKKYLKTNTMCQKKGACYCSLDMPCYNECIVINIVKYLLSSGSLVNTTT